jgi:hypothetical protein
MPTNIKLSHYCAVAFYQIRNSVTLDAATLAAATAAAPTKVYPGEPAAAASAVTVEHGKGKRPEEDVHAE